MGFLPLYERIDASRHRDVDQTLPTKHAVSTHVVVHFLQMVSLRESHDGWKNLMAESELKAAYHQWDFRLNPRGLILSAELFGPQGTEDFNTSISNPFLHSRHEAMNQVTTLRAPNPFLPKVR